MEEWHKVSEITSKLQEGRAEDPILGLNVVVLVVKINAIAKGSRRYRKHHDTEAAEGGESSEIRATEREDRHEAPAHLHTAHITVGDETGTIALVVTGRDRISLLDTLFQCGTAAVIRGARVRVFRGWAQLCLERGSGSLRSFTFRGEGAASTRSGNDSSLRPPQPLVAPVMANTDPSANVSAIRWIAVPAKPKRQASCSSVEQVEDNHKEKDKEEGATKRDSKQNAEEDAL